MSNPHGVAAAQNQEFERDRRWRCRCGEFESTERADLAEHMLRQQDRCADRGCGVERWNHSHYVAGDHPFREATRE